MPAFLIVSALAVSYCLFDLYDRFRAKRILNSRKDTFRFPIGLCNNKVAATKIEMRLPLFPKRYRTKFYACGTRIGEIDGLVLCRMCSVKIHKFCDEVTFHEHLTALDIETKKL